MNDFIQTASQSLDSHGELRFPFRCHFSFRTRSTIEDIVKHFLHIETWSSSSVGSGSDSDVTPPVISHSKHLHGETCIGEASVDLLTIASGPSVINTYIRDKKGRRKGVLQFKCYMSLVLLEWPIILKNLQIERKYRNGSSRISLTSTCEGSDVIHSFSVSEQELKFVHPTVEMSELLSPDPPAGLQLSLLSNESDKLYETFIPYRDIFPQSREENERTFSCDGIISACAVFPIATARIAQLIGVNIELAPNGKSVSGDARIIFPGFVIAPNLPQNIPVWTQETMSTSTNKSLRGWEERVDLETGVRYFAYRNTRQTTFVDPRGLPSDWEQRISEDGRVYFLRPHDSTTTYNDPRKKISAYRGL